MVAASSKGKPKTSINIPTHDSVVIEKDFTTLKRAEVIFCEPCDKEFTSPEAYEAHAASHEGCSHEGCSFTGTKKVVSAHFHSAHGEFAGTGYKDIDVEGQSFRVLLGTSPEEVEQWREARRQRFPSAALMQAKRESQERVAEVGGLDNTNQGRNAKRKHATTASSNDAKKPRQDVPAVGDADAQRELESEAKESKQTDEKQDDVSSSTNKPRSPCYNFQQGKCQNGDNCSYLHDTDAEFVPVPCKFFLRGQCRHGKRCRNIHERPSGEVGDEDAIARKNKRKGELYMPKPLAGGSRGTLLKSLLRDAASSEENLLLQAIRRFANQKRALQIV